MSAPARIAFRCGARCTLESSDGLVAKTEAADYSQSEGILRAPGPASFTKGRMSGSSVGMTYDKGRDAISHARPRVDGARPGHAGESAGPDITSGSAYFARADHYVRYERGFTLVSGARTLSSALATAYLTDDGARVESLEMRGSSRITGVGEGAGALRAMDADDINLEFAGDGRTLARRDAGEPPPRAGEHRAGRRWRGAPRRRPVDRRAVRGGRGDGQRPHRARVGRPDAARRAAERRRGRSAPSRSSRRPKAGRRWTPLDSWTTSSIGSRPRARPRESCGPARSMPPRGPGLGSMTDARFSGAVRFEEGQLRAASGQARYLVDRGRIDLDGVDETTGQSPRVTDGQVAIDAAAHRDHHGPETHHRGPGRAERHDAGREGRLVAGRPRQAGRDAGAGPARLCRIRRARLRQHGARRRLHVRGARAGEALAGRHDHPGGPPHGGRRHGQPGRQGQRGDRRS